MKSLSILAIIFLFIVVGCQKNDEETVNIQDEKEDPLARKCFPYGVNSER